MNVEENVQAGRRGRVRNRPVICNWRSGALSLVLAGLGTLQHHFQEVIVGTQG